MIKWIARTVAVVATGVIVGLIIAWLKGELKSKKFISWIVALVIVDFIAGLIIVWSEFKPLPQPPVISQPKPQEKIVLPEKPKPIPPRPQPSEQPLPTKAPPVPPSPKATASTPRPTEPKEVPKTKAPSKQDDLLSEGGIFIGNPEKYPNDQSRKWPVQMWIVLNGKNESIEGTVIGPTPNDGVFYPVYVGLSSKNN